MKISFPLLRSIGFSVALALSSSSFAADSDSIRLLSAALACPAPQYEFVRRNVSLAYLDRNTYVGDERTFRVKTRRKFAVLADHGAPSPSQEAVEFISQADYADIAEVEVDEPRSSYEGRKREVTISCKGKRPCFKILGPRNDEDERASFIACNEATAFNIKAVIDALTSSRLNAK